MKIKYAFSRRTTVPWGSGSLSPSSHSDTFRGKVREADGLTGVLRRQETWARLSGGGENEG